MFFFFFFQAEDGIRDLTVTGVQTCALPISAAVATPWTLAMTGWGMACTVVINTVQTSNSSRYTAAEIGRANSSHSQISYAVFCLKKKKTSRENHSVRRSNTI